MRSYACRGEESRMTDARPVPHAASPRHPRSPRNPSWSDPPLQQDRRHSQLDLNHSCGNVLDTAQRLSNLTLYCCLDAFWRLTLSGRGALPLTVDFRDWWCNGRERHEVRPRGLTMTATHDSGVEASAEFCEDQSDSTREREYTEGNFARHPII
ncbi:hypothetical protein BD626DRAFT_520879 [Schizophyllum amplum]|uniref:Uncharacterized protein n=1 Tax=Schizophyllum amplum TaxID=97359 RepID=A0A550BUA1_9AGAR|nr:hypothetical protein BD626DRAFT_520879 [Auriculariopsis ampla]